jgi:GNAT superfamily N-acetyltransferase
VIDQCRDVSDYRQPSAIDEQVARQGLRLHRAEKGDAERVLAFERETFPHWAEHFEACIRGGAHHDVACLSSPSRIVGAALLGRPGTTFPGSQWQALTRRGLGSYATLGIAEAYRGRGLGYALSAFATRCVRDDGATVCFINHSEAAQLYRKLGFAEWAEYRAAEIAS